MRKNIKNFYIFRPPLVLDMGTRIIALIKIFHSIYRELVTIIHNYSIEVFLDDFSLLTLSC